LKPLAVPSNLELQLEVMFSTGDAAAGGYCSSVISRVVVFIRIIIDMQV
jgi:hypothetical protein